MFSPKPLPMEFLTGLPHSGGTQHDLAATCVVTCVVTCVAATQAADAVLATPYLSSGYSPDQHALVHLSR